MASLSSWPAPAFAKAPDVVVLGRARALDAVASTLHARRFGVTRVVDAREPSMPRASAQVFIVSDAVSLEQLRATVERAQVLVIGTSLELQQAIAKYEGADAARVDFVRVGDELERGELDPDVLSEIALRALRLWRVGASRRQRLRAWLGRKVRRDRPVAPSSESELHDPESGRLDAARLADFFGVKLSVLAGALGRNYQTVHKTPAAESLQAALGPFARVVDLLLKLHGTRERALAWLHAPHGELGERTPLSVMLEGRADVVRDMLLGAYAGLPT